MGLHTLNLQNQIFLIIALFSLIPAVILLIYFNRLKIMDYLLLSLAYFGTVIQGLILVLLSQNQENLLLQQIDDFIYPTILLFFLIHGFRLNWKSSPRILWLIGIGWYTFLILVIPFYSLKSVPTEGTFLFFRVENTSSLPQGQILDIGNFLTIGQGFELVFHFFRLFSLSILFYSYYLASELAKEQSINHFRQIFIIALISSFVFPLTIISQAFGVYIFPTAIDYHVFDALTFILIAFVSIVAPETLLISRVQVMRALNLYSETDLNNKTVGEIGEKMDSIKLYLLNALETMKKKDTN